METDIRWKQRFSNYEKAFKQLSEFIEKGLILLPVFLIISAFTLSANEYHVAKNGNDKKPEKKTTD
jgi:hypothetical protein